MREESTGSAAAKGCILLVFVGGVAAVIAVGLALALIPVSGGGSGPVAIEADPAPPTRPTPGPKPAPAGPAGAAVKRIRERGVLRIATDSGEPPWSGTPPMFVMNAAGEYDGFDIALAQVIADAIGVDDLKVVHTKYSGLEERLLDPARDVDLLIGGYTPTDTAGIAWSDPYLEYGLCLVVPRASPVKTVADLFGKPVGIFDDDAAAEEVGRLVKGYTELVRLEDGYWDQLADGRFAGFLYDYPYAAAEIGLWYAQNPSRKGSLRIAQYNLTDSTYAVGVRADEGDLLTLVNDAIAAWRGSEAYPAAIKAWLKGGAAVDATPADARVVTVQKGDTLSAIAARELGGVDRWPALWEKNRDRFPNPHLIEVGDKVVLP